MERQISQLIDILNFSLFSAPPDPAENNLIAKQIKIAKLKFKAQKFKSLDEVYDAIKWISRSQASTSWTPKSFSEYLEHNQHVILTRVFA